MRAPDDIPQAGQAEPRDWHPDEQPGDNDEDALNWTEDEADAVQIYISRMKSYLHLDNWDIYLSATASKPEANASVHPVYGRRVAPISVNRNWWSYPPREQRNTIVHELLHIAHNAQTEVIRTTPTAGWMWRTFERETELMVDHLAGVLEDYMPMPITPQEVAEMRAAGTGPFAKDD